MIRNGKQVGLAVVVSMLAVFGALSTASANHNVKTLITTGSTGGNGAFTGDYVANTPSGSRAYFETFEKMVAGDTDSSIDIYERLGSTTTLLSTGPTGGNGAFDAFWTGISDDGTRVFFETDEKLVAADTDSVTDVYERSGSTTTLLSTGPSGGNGAFAAIYTGSSADGTRVFFDTDESLVTGDTDTVGDVYQNQSGTTTRISAGVINGNGAFFAAFLDASEDGTRVFFDTDEKLVAADTDAEVDIYERSGGTTTWISAGSPGGNGAFPAFYGGSSADGTTVVFESDESLATGDTDARTDIFERSGGTTTRVSTGTGGGNGAFDALLPIPEERFVSDDGSHIFFETSESLAAGDTDAQRDVYDRSAGTTTHVSIGSTGGNGALSADFVGASAAGTTAFIETTESLVAGDTDTRRDIYERTGGTTTHVSIGASGGNGNTVNDNASYALSSTDGARVFFETNESLEAGDTDAVRDVYERFEAATTRISFGPTGGNGAFTAFLNGITDDGTRAYFDTQESLVTTDTDTSVDVYVAAADPNFPRPGGGSPLRVPLIPAYAECTSPNTTHVAPAFGAGGPDGSCSPQVPESSLLTMGTLGAGQASAKFTVQPGDTGTPTIDEADVAITVSATDVRNTAGGTDYTGQVLFATGLRITDRANGFDFAETGTMEDFTFSFPISCVATGGANGSNCTASTTTDTLVPGFAKETRRTILNTRFVRLLDRGADGSITPPSGSCPPTCGSGDENVFQRQGLFAP